MGTQKNKTLFKSIFESEYIPLEGLSNRNQEHWSRHQRISKEILYFSENLNEKERKRFEEFNNLISETQEEELYFAYAEGLRTGLILIAELLFRKY